MGVDMDKILIKIQGGSRIVATHGQVNQTSRSRFSAIMKQDSFGFFMREMLSGSIRVIKESGEADFNYDTSTLFFDSPDKHHGMLTISWTVEGELK